MPTHLGLIKAGLKPTQQDAAGASAAATNNATTIATPDMSKIPRLPGDGAQMEDTGGGGDLPPSLRASTTSILSNLRKKQQAMMASGGGGGGGGGGLRGGITKQTPLRVQSVRIVEAKRAYGPKRRTESCSIFGNSNFGKRGLGGRFGVGFALAFGGQSRK